MSVTEDFDGDEIDVTVLRGTLVTIDEDSITVSDGDGERTFAITDETRQRGGDLAPADDVVVFALNGDARLVAPSPSLPSAFSRFSAPEA